MRRWTAFWVLGALLVLVGSVLLFVPVVPSGPHTVTPPVLETQERWYWTEVNLTTYSITGSIPFSLVWSATAEVYLDYAICPGPRTNFTGFFNGSSSVDGCQEAYGLTGSTPASTVSWSMPLGGSVVLAWALTSFGPNNVSISYTTYTGVTYLGAFVVVVGAGAMALGVISFYRASRSGVDSSRGSSDNHP